MKSDDNDNGDAHDVAVRYARLPQGPERRVCAYYGADGRLIIVRTRIAVEDKEKEEGG